MNTPAYCRIVDFASMTASLCGLSSKNLQHVRRAWDLTLHLHYIKSSSKTNPKTTVYLMHPNQTPARLCC
jgi:hypothetical protein